MVGDIVTRFAPSPSGYLHIGHAASAAKAFGFAHKHDGICILRIEDIDQTRCKPEYETAIYEDLNWLGLRWPTSVRRQSEHMAEYDAVLTKLQNMDLIYPCIKTRKNILEDIARAPHDIPTPYRRSEMPTHTQKAAILATNKPCAWRLCLARCKEVLGEHYDRMTFFDNGLETYANPDRLGDVILARKDVGTSYHIACCHDDALQGVTDIVRGVDLLESTHIHRLLQELLGWPVPRYHHHPLLTGPDGKRYAKRDKAKTLRAMRQCGASPENILAQAGVLG